MSSETSIPEMSSDCIVEKTAPLAQPETSDSAMESSSDANSIDSVEQKTDSSVVSPTQDVSTSGYVGEPASETGSGLSALPLDESPSENSAAVPPEAGSGSTPAAQDPDESQPQSAKDLSSAVETSPSTCVPNEVKLQPEQAKEQSISALESLPSTSSAKSPLLSAKRSPSIAYDKTGVEAITNWESPPSTSKVLSPFEQPSDFAAESDRLVGTNAPDNELARWVVPDTPRFSIPPRAYYVPRPRLVDNRQYSGFLGTIVHFLRGWQAYSIFMSDSIFLVPFQIVLLTLAFSAVSMGSLNLKNCWMANEIPMLILALGFLGFLAITLRIVFVIYNYFSHLLSCLSFQRHIIIFVNIIFLMLFSFEMYTFFTYTPSFDVSSESYCSPVFYTYGYILNCAVTLLVAVLFGVHFPAFLFNHFQIGGPGIPDNDEE